MAPPATLRNLRHTPNWTLFYSDSIIAAALLLGGFMLKSPSSVRHRRGRSVPKAIAGTLALAVGLLLATVRGWPQAGLQAVAENTSYNVGDKVRLNILFPGAVSVPTSDFSVTLRYAGDDKPLLNQIALSPASIPSGIEHSTGYHEIWKIPLDARTGRYEIDVVAQDSKSCQIRLQVPHAASFVVHKKLVRIERIELGKTFYTPGDAVACRASLKNLTARPLAGLRVEFSDRYWPWIAPSSERTGVDVFPIVKALSLGPRAEVEVRSSRAAVAKAVRQPTVHQYAVVVWDRERRNIYDIAFSPLVFIQPPGVDSPKPYPLQYVYRDLDTVDTSSYRQFIRPELNSAAIQFDRNHTMFAAESEATVSFSVVNPSERPWHEITIRARLLSLGSAGSADKLVAEGVHLEPRGAPLKKETKFTFPGQASGVFRAQVEVSNATGEVLATNTLELGANPLPKSILIFCAHEDDEMAHAGIIRAAVENRIPLRVVYFTSGDAGSCDRYYQHSCDPAEALNFGALRMEEARAALGHLGVPREDIYFLGLPDGGSGEIWSRHLEPSNPYLSVLLATDHAPYDALARPNLPYARRSAVEAAKDFIRKFQPEVIYTGHPDERHVDHRTNNWFVVKALQELVREGAISADLKLLVDQVYGPGPQARAPYRYEKHLLHVSGEVMARAQEAVWFHQSQSGNRALGRLHSFDQLRRPEIHWQVLDWNEHAGWNEKE